MLLISAAMFLPQNSFASPVDLLDSLDRSSDTSTTFGGGGVLCWLRDFLQVCFILRLPSTT